MQSNESVVDVYNYEVFGEWFKMVDDGVVRRRLIQKAVGLLQRCGMFSLTSIQGLQVDPVVGLEFGSCTKENGSLDEWLIARYLRPNFVRAIRELVDNSRNQGVGSEIRSRSVPVAAPATVSGGADKVSLEKFLASSWPASQKSGSCRQVKRVASRLNLFSQSFVLRVLSFVESRLVGSMPDEWWIKVADSSLELATLLSGIRGESVACVLNQQDLPNQVTSAFAPDADGRIQFSQEDLCLVAIIGIRSGTF